MFERPNAVMQMFRDQDGSYWIGSQRGLWRQRGGTAPMPQRASGEAIAGAVSTILAQADGALWVSITGVGLGYLGPDWRQLAQYSRSQDDGLRGGMYRALTTARDGGFWLGGYNGSLERLTRDGSIVQADRDVLGRLRDMKLSAVAEDSIGNIWLGSRLGLIRVGVDGAIDERRADDPRVADDGRRPAGVHRDYQPGRDPRGSGRRHPVAAGPRQG